MANHHFLYQDFEKLSIGGGNDLTLEFDWIHRNYTDEIIPP